MGSLCNHFNPLWFLIASFHLATMTHGAAPNISPLFHWHQILEVSAIRARASLNRSRTLHSLYHHRCHRHHRYTTNIWHTWRCHRCHRDPLWKSATHPWWSTRRTWCFCTISCRGTGACCLTILSYGHHGWTMRGLLSSPCGQHSGPAVLGTNKSWRIWGTVGNNNHVFHEQVGQNCDDAVDDLKRIWNQNLSRWHSSKRLRENKPWLTQPVQPTTVIFWDKLQLFKNMFATSSAKYQVQTSLLPTLGSFHAVSHFAPWVVASLPKLADNLPVTRCLGHPRGEPMISGVIVTSTCTGILYIPEIIRNIIHNVYTTCYKEICPSMFLTLHHPSSKLWVWSHWYCMSWHRRAAVAAVALASQTLTWRQNGKRPCRRWPVNVLGSCEN